jgi:hypothetical protein
MTEQKLIDELDDRLAKYLAASNELVIVFQCNFSKIFHNVFAWNGQIDNNLHKWFKFIGDIDYNKFKKKYGNQIRKEVRHEVKYSLIDVFECEHYEYFFDYCCQDISQEERDLYLNVRKTSYKTKEFMKNFYPKAMDTIIVMHSINCLVWFMRTDPAFLEDCKYK